MNKTELPNGIVVHGDSLEVVSKLKDNSIDCVITSPPYFHLRDYGYDGQWGLESDYNEYLDNLINLMREIKRVLKSTGTIWINLGDTYVGSKSGNGNPKMNSNVCDTQSKINKKVKNMPNKSLMMIPHRFAIRCVDELGLILRNDIIWASKNKMPEPATDRFSKKKEYIFFFTKSTKYYFDLDGIRDIPITGTNRKDIIKSKTSGSLTAKKSGREKEFDANGFIEMKNNPMGKNPGDVSDFWDINTKPSKIKHYASYPDTLVTKPLIAGCPSEVCTICGVPVVTKIKTKSVATRPNNSSIYDDSTDEVYTRSESLKERRVPVEVGVETTKCKCHAPTKPGIVLDPFAGSGTTAVSAINNNRTYMMIDASEEYYNIMVDRLRDIENSIVINTID